MKKSDTAAVQKETVELINYVDGVGQISCQDSAVSTVSVFQKTANAVNLNNCVLKPYLEFIQQFVTHLRYLMNLCTSLTQV